MNVSSIFDMRVNRRSDNLNPEFGFLPIPTKYLLIGVLLMAIALRLILVFQPEVIHNDGIEYIRHAKEVLIGNWTGGASGPVYPVLIAFTYLITNDFEQAGIWVSIVFGAFLVIPVFYLAKEIFDARVGKISALLATVHPFLYLPSGSVLTEATYHFFIATTVYFGWLAFKKARTKDILFFSLFACLAFLTRPEAIGFLFIFSFWALFLNPPQGQRLWVKRIAISLATILLFLVFSSPYLIAIRKETGKWSISKKVNVSILETSEKKDETPLSKGKVWRHGLSFISLLKQPFSLLRIVGPGLFESFYKFQQVFNPILFILALWGWMGIFQGRSQASPKPNFYLLSHHFFYFGFVYPIFWVTRRYTSQMIPLTIPWAAFGLCLSLDWVVRHWKDSWRKEKLISIFLLLFLIGLFIQGRVIHTREHRVIRKEAGLWMKDHLPKGSILMSRLPQEAFYADLSWIKFPKKEYEEVLKMARSKGVQYLILDEDIGEDSPDFLKKIKEKDLILIKDFKKDKQHMILFKVVDAE